MIRRNLGTISTLAISTILGHSGRGMFPYCCSPEYRQLLQVVQKTETTVFTKSSTFLRKKGNWRLFYPWTWKYIQPIRNNGLLNAYGLTNLGVNLNAKNILYSCKLGYKVIPNFYPEFFKGNQAIVETILAMEKYYEILKNFFWAIELDFSCHNVKEVIADNVEAGVKCIEQIKKKFFWLTIIVKTSIVHKAETLQVWEKAGADIFHCINTIPFSILFPNNCSPLELVGGGSVSGSPTTKIALGHNVLMNEAVKVPVIFGCGVMNENNVGQCLEAGAQAVSICTLAKINPIKAKECVNYFNG